MDVFDRIQLALALRMDGCGGRLDETGSLVSGELPDGVRIVVDRTEGAAVGQLFHRDGRTLTQQIDLGDPATLAFFLHNVDDLILWRPLADGLNTFDIVAIDALALASEDVSDRILRPRFRRMPDRTPQDRHVSILVAMTTSDIPALERAGLEALRHRRDQPKSIDPLLSQVRTAAVVDAMFSAEGDPMPNIVPVGAGRHWRRILTEAGARTVLGCIDPEHPAAMPRCASWDSADRRANALAKVLAKVRSADEGEPAYVLGADDGAPTAVALLAETGLKADPLDGMRLTEWDLEAVDELAAAASDLLTVRTPKI